MSTKVRARLLRFSEILGIREIEITPGDVTVIEGKNAEGKTSILDGIKAICTGGKDATLMRNGADKAEAVLELTDGLRAVRSFEVKPNRDGEEEIREDFSLSHPDFGALTKPRSRFDKIIDMVALDPARFMSTNDEDRLRIITEIADVKLDNERIAIECALDLDTVNEITGTVAGLNPLDLLAHVKKSIAAIRLNEGKRAKEKRAAIAQLEPTLSGADTSVKWSEEADRLADLESTLSQQLNNTVNTFRGSVRSISDAAANAYLEARTEAAAHRQRRLDAFLAEIDLEFQASVNEAAGLRDRKVENARNVAARREEEKRAELEPQIADALVKKISARGNAEAVSREANTRSMIDQFTKEAVEAEDYFEVLTNAIDGIKDLKGKLLEEMPIPGIDLVDGVIHMDNVPWRHMNRQKQMYTCIEVAKARAKMAGGLGLVVIDNLECLDSEHFEEFVDQALKTDLQWVVGRVTDRPGVNIRVVNADDRRAA